MTDDAQRFEILFTGANKALTWLGMGPNVSGVEVDADTVRVRMGWAFRSEIPRSSIQSVAEDSDRVWGWGVHGWRGRWLVNGSSSNVVRIEIEPEVRAKMSVVSVRLHTLRISVADPDGLRAALSPTS